MSECLQCSLGLRQCTALNLTIHGLGRVVRLLAIVGTWIRLDPAKQTDEEKGQQDDQGQQHIPRDMANEQVAEEEEVVETEGDGHESPRSGQRDIVREHDAAGRDGDPQRVRDEHPRQQSEPVGEIAQQVRQVLIRVLALDELVELVHNAEEQRAGQRENDVPHIQRRPECSVHGRQQVRAEPGAHDEKWSHDNEEEGAEEHEPQQQQRQQADSHRAPVDCVDQSQQRVAQAWMQLLRRRVPPRLKSPQQCLPGVPPVLCSVPRSLRDRVHHVHDCHSSSWPSYYGEWRNGDMEKWRTWELCVQSSLAQFGRSAQAMLFPLYCTVGLMDQEEILCIDSIAVIATRISSPIASHSWHEEYCWV
ncbi:hypothetical protein Mp_1g17950 [Marchantia polymorpha subsp. ruderalis]|uniref:Uncharacterized protein n=2 Tax=Marchantia polymorpha TaxID=3197 RepID=A0AAF6ARD6_MARPO|nr:hypothetical protein MARPO_0001s0133 [Marchantia polymorpha]BBM99006.1 hypothetical protein Mp_1g17950 [Marchantia polymorpha subsp. ruderalis]|eukprot:PTQ50082.1 hypothetical protein MARPO_0001s0133 [Marchantia polymorpha]